VFLQSDVHAVVHTDEYRAYVNEALDSAYKNAIRSGGGKDGAREAVKTVLGRIEDKLRQIPTGVSVEERRAARNRLFPKK